MKRLILVALLCAPVITHAQTYDPNEIAKIIGGRPQSLSDKEKLDALIDKNGGVSSAPTESKQPKFNQKFWDEAKKKFGSPKKCIDLEMQKNKDLGVTVTVSDYDKIVSDCNFAGMMFGIQ